ncbi:MAG: M48 family metallopeptidase [Planctomycetes bacterium]|nr:M48 family metallopeptidase [Planctomycetota bacterium]
MSSWSYLIAAILILPYILDLIVEMLDLKSASSSLPPEVSDVYDSEEYKKSLSYHRENTRFGLIVGTLGLAIMLIAIYSGAFATLDSLSRKLSPHSGEISQGLVFIGLFSIISYFISLPVKLYGTFVIEEKYGFNRTTAKTFILDQLKAFALGIIIGCPLLALLIGIFDWAADNTLSWLYAWALFALFQGVMLFLSPLLMGLFYKFEALEEGELKNKIEGYAQKQQFSLAGLYKMDGSRRSTKSNAFFAGFGKLKKIVLFDTLIEKSTDDELLLILAHEMGHYKLKHILRQMIFSLMSMALVFFLLQSLLKHEELFAVFGMEPSIYASLLLISSIVLSPLMVLMGVISNYFSRRFEYQADAYAANTTGKGQVMIDALKKLSRDNLSNLNPHPFKTFLEYSHPTVVQRIRALKAL